MTSRAHRVFWSVLFLAATVQCSGSITPPGATDPEPVETGKGGSGGGAAGANGGVGGSGGRSSPESGGETGASGPDASAGQDSGTSPPGSAPAEDAGVNSTPAGPWARGIQIGLVEVSQGVFIKLGEREQVVAPADRNAPLIEGRPMVVRIFVTPGPEFTSRRLRGVVSIETNGVTKQFEETKTINEASDPDEIDSTFNVLIPAAEVKPDASLWAAIYEEGAATGEDPGSPPRFPASGATDLAVKAGRMVLDVVMVPVTGPGGPLDDTPARRKTLENHIYDLYPVQQVNLKFRPPVVVNARITERTEAFGLLRDARTEDGASARPWEYYHLLVAREDTTFNFSGTAGGRGGGANDPGARRVALTLVRRRAIDGNTNTGAHELGHNHGEGHIPACGAGGNNSTYPLPQGELPTGGWSLSENALKERGRFKELMGYCRPRWISDFMWKRFEERVRSVSTTASETPPEAVAFAERSLVGYVAPGERPNWGMVPERLVADGTTMTSGRYARVVLDDGRVISAPVSVHVMSDEVTRELAVTLPPGAEAEHAEVFVDGERFTIGTPTLIRQ